MSQIGRDEVKVPLTKVQFEMLETLYTSGLSMSDFERILYGLEANGVAINSLGIFNEEKEGKDGQEN